MEEVLPYTCSMTCSSDPKDCRPIALMSHIMKILERLALVELRPMVRIFTDTLQFARPTLELRKLSSSEEAEPSLHLPGQGGKHCVSHVL